MRTTLRPIAALLAAAIAAAALAAAEGDRMEEAFRLYREGKHDEAFAAAEEARKAAPSDPAPLHLIGRVQADRGRHEEAIGALERCLTLSPRPAWITGWSQLYLGRCHAALGDREQAREWLEKAAGLAVDGKGVVWLAYYRWRKMGRWSRDREVHARRLEGGRWTPEVQASPADVPEYEDHTDPGIAGLPEGGAALAWSWDYHPPTGGGGHDAAGPSIFGRRTGAGGEPGPVTLLGRTGRGGNPIDFIPAIAALADGSLLVAWDSWSNASRRRSLLVARWEESRVGTPERLWSGECVDSPQLVTDRDGGARLVAGVLREGRWSLVQARWRRGSWSGPEPIETGEGDPRFPSAAIGPDGRLRVAFVRVQEGTWTVALWMEETR